MKFINTGNRYLINPEHVKYFRICEDGEVQAVFGRYVIEGSGDYDHSVSFRGGKTREEAAKFVINLINRLNTEE